MKSLTRTLHCSTVHVQALILAFSFFGSHSDLLKPTSKFVIYGLLLNAWPKQITYGKSCWVLLLSSVMGRILCDNICHSPFLSKQQKHVSPLENASCNSLATENLLLKGVKIKIKAN